MRDKLIIALDVPEQKEAEELINLLEPEVDYFKVGLELFLNTRGSILEYIKAKNKKIFLDLKFHDIPNTVKEAVRWAVKTGVDMFNVHASGGEMMLTQAVEIVKETAVKSNVKQPLIIGVTLLTSLSEDDLKTLGLPGTVKDRVVSWARLCQRTGVNGVVCSAKEVAEIKEACGKNFVTVCPGVRPFWAQSEDQKRVMTPSEAVQIGADYLVIGRPVIKNKKPLEAVRKILKEMEEAK